MPVAIARGKCASYCPWGSEPANRAVFPDHIVAMKAKIAVIGCGSWSTEAHLPALLANPDAEVIAVVDPAHEARDQAARRFGVKRWYASHTELFDAEHPDGVVIATPHAHHYEPALAALNSGAHVLVEKPLVLSPAQARGLQRVASARSLEVIVGYTWHYNRQSIELRSLIAAGRLGRLEFASSLFASMVRAWYRGDIAAYQAEFKLTRIPRFDTYSDPAISGGGQGQAQVTHSAALLFWLTGLRPRRVTAFCANFGLQVDLVDAAAIAFDGGVVGTVSSTGGRPSGHDDLLHLHVSGTDGLAVYEVMEGRATIYLPDGGKEELAPVTTDQRYPHWGPANNLVDVVLGRGENGSSVEIGCVTVEFLDAMYRSAAAGGVPVDVTPATSDVSTAQSQSQ
jgi:predicted dehydrogenase